MLPIEIYIEDGNNNKPLSRCVPFCPRIGEKILIAMDKDGLNTKEYIVSNVQIYATVYASFFGEYTSVTNIYVVPKTGE
jgi:hypothetical protein